MPQRRKNFEIYKFLKSQLNRNLPAEIKKLKEEEGRLLSQASQVIQWKLLKCSITFFCLVEYQHHQI